MSSIHYTGSDVDYQISLGGAFTQAVGCKSTASKAAEAGQADI